MATPLNAGGKEVGERDRKREGPIIIFCPGAPKPLPTNFFENLNNNLFFNVNYYRRHNNLIYYINIFNIILNIFHTLCRTFLFVFLL